MSQNNRRNSRTRRRDESGRRGPARAGDFKRVARGDDFAQYEHPDGTEVRVWRNKSGWHAKVAWDTGARRQDFTDDERGVRNAFVWAADFMEDY